MRPARIKSPLRPDIELDAAVAVTGDDIATIHGRTLRAWRERMQNAFDLGFKAAGGTMVPDASADWSMVEMSLDRKTINALADVADAILGDPDDALCFEDEAPLLRQFLETISIYRSKK